MDGWAELFKLRIGHTGSYRRGATAEENVSNKRRYQMDFPAEFCNNSFRAQGRLNEPSDL